MIVKVAARDSLLSKMQVKEFQEIACRYFPDLMIEPIWMKTFGDLHHEISLRDCKYDDFFTREVDDAVLKSRADIAIHSAKDLPNDLDPNLEIFLLTKGIDPRDSLVIKEGYLIQTIPKNGIILASSDRRAAMIQVIRSDLVFQDVRGTIHERIAQLNQENVYGVVVAEAAIIRLNLQSMNRVILDFPTHPMQGKLAIVGKKENSPLKQLFSQIDA
jgi:hydroxymethylbilane synthase